MRMSALILIFGIAAMAADSTPPLSSAADVVARMMERDNQRQAAFHGYTGTRRYVLENVRHHKRAEMLVKVTCQDNGSKQFELVSATGWGAARNHVFPKLLQGESEASMPDARDRSRIAPENYTFELVGQEVVNQRPAYVLAMAPKKQNKYLVEGMVWVDVEDYAIVRIEGKPTKNPSFWIKSVHFIHDYQKNGSHWLPSTDKSVTEARIIGTTELTIEYYDYASSTPGLSASREIAKSSAP